MPMKRHALSMMAVAGFILILLFAARGDDPHAIDLLHALQPPSLDQPFGTDHLGRSVAARLADGLWRTLAVLFLLTAIAIPAGLGLGLLAIFGPEAMSRMAVCFARCGVAVPTFILALAATAVFGLSPVSAGVAIGVAAAAQYALLVSELGRTTLKEHFVLASVALGTSPTGIAVRHVIPTLAPVLRRHLSTDLARAVVAYAGLAFIGLGADTSRSDWGAMAWEYRAWLFDAPWLLMGPAVAVGVLAGGLSFAMDD
jgi:peptide/nickel transport system permease protein